MVISDADDRDESPSSHAAAAAAAAATSTAASTAESHRLISLLNDGKLDSALSSALSSHIATVPWTKDTKDTSGRLVRTALQVAMAMHTNGNDHTALLSRRVLTDAILPLSTQGCNSNEASNEADAQIARTISELIRSIITQDLFPSLQQRHDSVIQQHDDIILQHHDRDTYIQHDTCAPEILLPSFLHRLQMDSDIKSNSNCNISIEPLIDQLCNAASKSNPQTCTRILSILRELQILSPNSLTQNPNRPTSLLRMALSSLDSAHANAMPPLIYQIGLLPAAFSQEDRSPPNTSLRTLCAEGIARAMNRMHHPAHRTSLLHLGACLRSDPYMAEAIVALLEGGPFRYSSLTPGKLAVGLSLAWSVPRMRPRVLGCVRDLVVEGEMMRVRCGCDCGVGGDGVVIGLGRPWMRCLVRGLEGEGRWGHAFKCLVGVAKFAASGESGDGDGGCGSLILQSLISVGFLLIDCVKKEEPAGSSKEVVPASLLLAKTLDTCMFGNVGHVPTLANHAASRTGRTLLCYLFYQSAASSVSSSLSSSNGSNPGGTALCRSILKTCIDKICGMAPNAPEYAKLFTDLLQFTPACLNYENAELDHDCDGIDGNRSDEVIALTLATHHIPVLIDTLANVPAGGMDPRAASQAIIPAVGSLLLLQASARPGLAGYLWKKRDIIDHVDHAFLIAKKSLFCIDEDKRRCAAMMLVTLIGVATIASSAGKSRSSNGWTHTIDELRGCLRRCLTQHQQFVRIETYSSLVAMLPSASAATVGTQESTSPSNSSGVFSPSPSGRSRRSAPVMIPPNCREGLTEVICSILSTQLERYVSTPPEDIEGRLARQERASAIGSQLSQMADEESPQCDINEMKSMPFRFEMFISTSSSRFVTKRKGKSKKSLTIGQTFLNEALARINEPIGFLLASCNAACSVVEDQLMDGLKNQAELQESVASLRRRMAGCTDLGDYLVWIDGNKHIQEIANRKDEIAISKVSTLITIAVAAEVLMSARGWDGEMEKSFLGIEQSNKDLENLFNLRQDAISRASEVMTSVTSSKSKKSKILKELDMNREPDATKTKKTRRPKKGDVQDSDDEGATKVSTEANRTVRAKHQKLIEEAIHGISPGLPQDFLAYALRTFGATSESKSIHANELDSDEQVDSGVSKELARCMVFRRFIITKSLLHLGGASMVVKAGSSFASLGDNVMGVIASSLSLGPMLFTEFCSHCYHLERTSISPTSTNTTPDLPLTQLSLRAFSFCVAGMASDAQHSLSKAERVHALFTCATGNASKIGPLSKESWTYREDSNTGVSKAQVPEKEIALRRSLLPFISKPSNSRMCLFSELLTQSMNDEAAECATMIFAAASAFTDPNIREHLGVMMLSCWEPCDGNTGVLGLDFGGDNDTNTCLSTAIDVGFKLSNYLDGDTYVPLPPDVLGSTSYGILMARAQSGLPTTNIENWPAKQHDRLRDESAAPNMPGIVQEVAWALTATLTPGNRFADTFRRESPSLKQFQLPCIKSISKTSQPNFAREKSSIARSIASCIEYGLDNANFVTLKLLPHMSDKQLELAQRFVACLLLSISKVIRASAPSAEFMDINGSFASSLLKSAKLLYSIIVRFVLSYTMNPQSLACEETRCFLDFMTFTLAPRIAELLLTLQEKHETSGGKYLAESKIESHGKSASLLVFEKEKLDNALLKLAGTLKQAGFVDESDWVEKHVVTSLNSDFVIRGIQDAKEREARKMRKSSGSKRKVKSDPAQKKKKT